MTDHTPETTRIKTAVERMTILLAAIDAAGIPNDTALLDIREENGYLHVLCPADLRVLLDRLAEVEKALTQAWDEGVKATTKARLVQGESLPLNPYRQVGSSPVVPPCGHCGVATSCGKQDCDRARALSTPPADPSNQE